MAYDPKLAAVLAPHAHGLYGYGNMKDDVTPSPTMNV